MADHTTIPYAGFYVNLDSDVDRCAEIEAEISRFGMQHLYQRFPATKGNALGFPSPICRNPKSAVSRRIA
jgi:hypothetical protein